MGLYNFWYYMIIGTYKQRNAHRSLETALKLEREWQLNKPKDDDDDDEDEEEEE